MEKFGNKYRIPSARLQNWDYGWNAAYFVTICTKDKEHFFGEIEKTHDTENPFLMRFSEIGHIANNFWLEIPTHFPFAILGTHVVMPNHVHGIIIIDKPDNEPNVDGGGDVATNTGATKPPGIFQKSIGQKRFQNQGKHTLSSIIGSYKSVVTKHVRKIHSDFAWQPRFHDHIIRNDSSFKRIRDYIENNPKTWKDDTFYCD